MKILDEFDFDARPSRSRYAVMVKALVEDNAHAAVLKRGEDFPEGVQMATVQAGASAAMRKAGTRAITRIIDPDHLAVGVHPDQAPRRRNGRKRGSALTAVGGGDTPVAA